MALIIINLTVNQVWKTIGINILPTQTTEEVFLILEVSNGEWQQYLGGSIGQDCPREIIIYR